MRAGIALLLIGHGGFGLPLVGQELFQFIERSGDYALPVALFVLLGWRRSSAADRSGRREELLGRKRFVADHFSPGIPAPCRPAPRMFGRWRLDGYRAMLGSVRGRR